jgi:heptosyltransferase-2
MSSRIAAVERILVITKFGYLGDTIVATPFLRRLREAAPHAAITLMSGPAIPELLRGCPYVDRIEGFDRKAQGVFSAAARLRESRYDAVFLLNRSLHTGILAALAGIPLRVGHDTELRGFTLSVRVPYDWDKPDRECALDLLKAVGAEADPAMPELWVTDEEVLQARSRLKELGLDADSTIVGIQPGANDSYVREWRADRFAAVADRLAAEADARVVLFGGAGEQAASERTASMMTRPPVILTGSTNLREALALISQCGLWIGNDAGLLHAAAALGVPTVGIFGPTKAARWGYHGSRNRTIAAPSQSSGRDPDSIRQSLDSISTETVYEAARDLLSNLRATVGGRVN